MSFFEKYKNVIAIFVVMLLLLVAGTGIGFFGMRHIQHEKFEKEAVTHAVKMDVEGFLKSLEDGDPATAQLYCSADVAKGMGLDMMDIKEYRRVLLDGLSVKEEDLSEETAKNLDTLMKSLQKAIVSGSSYNIEELVIGEGDKKSVTATLPVKIKGCGSPVSVDFSGEIALANVSVANYTSENQKRLMDLYEKEGEEAVREELWKHELGSLFSAMNGQTEKAAKAERQWLLTFTVGKDEKGNITAATITNAAEIKDLPEEAEEDAEGKETKAVEGKETKAAEGKETKAADKEKEDTAE